MRDKRRVLSAGAAGRSSAAPGAGWLAGRRAKAAVRPEGRRARPGPARAQQPVVVKLVGRCASARCRASRCCQLSIGYLISLQDPKPITAAASTQRKAEQTSASQQLCLRVCVHLSPPPNVLPSSNQLLLQLAVSKIRPEPGIPPG